MRRLSLAVLAFFLATPISADTPAPEYHLDVEGAQLARLAREDPAAFAGRGERCEDLVACKCSMEPRRATETRSRLDEAANEYVWAKLSGNVTPDEYNEAAGAALVSSEQDAYELTRVRRSDVLEVLARGKARIREEANRRSGVRVSPAAAEAMFSTIHLRYGREYVGALVHELSKSYPGTPEPVLRTRGYILYHARCGMNGLKVNAFSSPPIGPNGERSLVLCPGLVIGLADLQTDKEATIASLSLVMGQELGFSLADSQPELFAEMANEISARTGVDVSREPAVARQLFADFWGGFALSKEVQAIEERSLRQTAVALALQTIIEASEGDDRSQIAAFRVANILNQFPDLAATLADSRPSWAEPRCAAARSSRPN